MAQTIHQTDLMYFGWVDGVCTVGTPLPPEQLGQAATGRLGIGDARAISAHQAIACVGCRVRAPNCLAEGSACSGDRRRRFRLPCGQPRASSGHTPSTFPGQRRVIRTDIAVLYVGDEAEKQALLLSEPEVFFTTPAYDWSPLVMVRLEAIDITRLRELVTDAWHMRAPASLKVEHPLVRGESDR